jgi:putative Mn2+ efflux pump MntP
MEDVGRRMAESEIRSNDLDREVNLEKTKKDFMDKSILGLGVRVDAMAMKLEAEVGH